MADDRNSRTDRIDLLRPRPPHPELIGTDAIPSTSMEGGESVPEADLLEQLSPADPALHEPDPVPPGDAQLAGPVDEADWWEQQLPVPGADDDYPYDSVESEWS